MTDWYTRPVFFVADVARALDFYVSRLGFSEKWRHAHDGQLLVAQADRDRCEVILSCQWPDKAGQGMVFISLSRAAFAALPGELADKGVIANEGYWGYPVLIVSDPDGNQLYFPDPDTEGGA